MYTEKNQEYSASFLATLKRDYQNSGLNFLTIISSVLDRCRGDLDIEAYHAKVIKNNDYGEGCKLAGQFVDWIPNNELLMFLINAFARTTNWKQMPKDYPPGKVKEYHDFISNDIATGGTFFPQVLDKINEMMKARRLENPYPKIIDGYKNALKVDEKKTFLVMFELMAENEDCHGISMKMLKKFYPEYKQKSEEKKEKDVKADEVARMQKQMEEMQAQMLETQRKMLEQMQLNMQLAQQQQVQVAPLPQVQVAPPPYVQAPAQPPPAYDNQ